jgi:hypothetical protein
VRPGAVAILEILLAGLFDELLHALARTLVPLGKPCPELQAGDLGDRPDQFSEGPDHSSEQGQNRPRERVTTQSCGEQDHQPHLSKMNIRVPRTLMCLASVRWSSSDDLSAFVHLVS